jgi:diguanylate cyclase (GGDEF)-like protein
MRVLIADDDPVSRRLLEVALVQMGHTVVVVSEGLAAIEALVAIDGPRIAIVDWMMPGADGLAVCRAVRQRAAPYVYVILLTARHSQADIVAAQDAEADEFLTKPFDILELRGRLLAGERILNLQEKLVQAHDAMEHQASHDLLTGLWNRRMILQQLDREVQRSARDRSELAVILADIDHFKRINDTYGHAAGDTVLQQVAGRLRSAVRNSEYLSRYGGEEFLIVLPGCTAERAMSVAERARASVAAAPVLIGGQPVSLRISLGVASTADAGVDLAALIAAADAALYQGKASGRDQVRQTALAATA